MLQSAQRDGQPESMPAGYLSCTSLPKFESCECLLCTSAKTVNSYCVNFFDLLNWSNCERALVKL
jgi:hypothetical protein